MKVLVVAALLIFKGLSCVVTERVSVMEGDSVTLHTGVQINQQEEIGWYFNNIRIARLNGDLSKICTDVQCNEDTERFRDRLKLDHQTGSLTITHTTNKHSGEYKLYIRSNNSEKMFSVAVHGVSAADRDAGKRKTVKEGESVTLDPGEVRNPSDVMTWYFNDILIAEITGDQSKICTDVQCKERFRDRLKLDNQTGSLTITHTRNTDSGGYHLQINSSFSTRRRRRSTTIVKSFKVAVIAGPDSGLSGGAIGGISAAVVVVAVLMIIAGAIIKKEWC